MRYTASFFVIFFLFYSQLGVSAESALTQKLFDESADRIFKVGIADSVSSEIQSHGTGFVISEDGLIATAYHVVNSVVELDRGQKKQPEVYVIRSGVRMKAAIWMVDSKNDLAVLKVPVKLPKPWPLDSKVARKGSNLFLLGYPGPAEFSIVTGLLQSASISEVLPTYQVTSPVTGGMSGGPVISASGSVVGVILARYSGDGDISLAGQAILLARLLEKAQNRKQEPTLEELRKESENGYFDLQNLQAGLLEKVLKDRTAFHGWMLPSASKKNGDIACNEWDTESSADWNSRSPTRSCDFKMTRSGDEVSFKIEYFAIFPRSNQFKTADLSNSYANLGRGRRNPKKKYGKFSCRPDLKIKKGENSFLVSVCSRVSDPSLNSLHSVIRVASLDFNRNAIVAKMDLKSFSKENSEKLILHFMESLEEANEPE